MLPQQFQVQGKAVASYDWLDMTSGAGYRNYYCCAAHHTEATYYILTTRANLDTATGEDLLYVKGAATDEDFDITIKVPVIAGGADALFNFSWTADNGAVTTVTINIYHVTALGAETLLGTANHAYNTVAAGQFRRECLRIAATSRKFAIGEKLRINVIVASTNANARYWIDPASTITLTDTESRTIGTDFICMIPFKIDIS